MLKKITGVLYLIINLRGENLCFFIRHLKNMKPSRKKVKNLQKRRLNRLLLCWIKIMNFRQKWSNQWES